jgi:ligand-binding sensor domain-containing protein
MKTILSVITFLILSLLGRSHAQDIVAEFFAAAHLKIITRDENDTYIWVGTKNGLYRINKQNYKYKFLDVSNSELPHNHVTSIVCKIDGQTYIGTKNGILFWDNNLFFVINTTNSGLPENHIKSLHLDQEGYLLIKTKKCRLIEALDAFLRICKMH